MMELPESTPRTWRTPSMTSPTETTDTSSSAAAFAPTTLTTTNNNSTANNAAVVESLLYHYDVSQAVSELSLSDMSQNEMDALAQQLSNRMDRADSNQEGAERHRHVQGETKQPARVVARAPSVTPSVSNFLRDMRNRDQHELHGSLGEPLLESPAPLSVDDTTKEIDASGNPVSNDGGGSNNNSSNHLCAPVCFACQFVCCCYDRCCLTRFVQYLVDWNTTMLVCMLHSVGAVHIAFHFITIYFFHQQGQTYHGTQTNQVLFWGGCLLHMSIIVWSIVVLVVVAKSITRWKILQMWGFYLLSCVLFGCVYRFYFVLDVDGISLPNGWGYNQHQQLTYVHALTNFTGSKQNSTGPLAPEYQVSVMCLYFSITTQTSVGYGDIVPVAVWVRVVSAIHMFVGMVYGSMLVGLTMESDMSVLITSRHQQLTRQLERLVRWRKLEQDKQDYFMGTTNNATDSSACTKYWARMKYGCAGCCCDYQGRCTCAFIKQCFRNAIVKRTRRFLRTHLLSFNVVVVLATNIILTVVAHENAESCSVEDSTCTQRRYDLDEAPMTVATCVHLVLLIVLLSVSMKYVKKTEKVTVLFLCCSFLATCLIFGSMYSLLSLYDHDAFGHTSHYAAALRGRNSRKTFESEIPFLGQRFFTFQYYSMTTMTTTGYGYLFPNSVVAMVVVVCQELLSFLFATYVLGVGIQSVATSINMKKNPSKYASLAQDEKYKKNISMIIGVGTGGGYVGGGGESNEHRLNRDNTSFETLGGHSRSSSGGGVIFDEGVRTRRGTETMKQLQDRLTSLESAMKDH